MKKVTLLRKKTQPNSKFRDRYNSVIQKLRENVIGEVCNRVDTLCKKYNAVPIFESSVKKLSNRWKFN